MPLSPTVATSRSPRSVPWIMSKGTQPEMDGGTIDDAQDRDAQDHRQGTAR